MNILIKICVTLFLVAINQSLAQLRLSTANGRIFGGRPIAISERTDYKHQVKLFATIKGVAYGCGGSILTPNIILTAAHCVYEASSCEVYFGLFNQNELGKAVATQIIPTQNIKIHENYNHKTLINDIAVLKTPQRIIFSDFVGPISLPENTDTCVGYQEAGVTVSGWGRTSDDPATSRATILKTASVHVAEIGECYQAWGGAYDPKTMICSTSPDSGVCKGDSGGPMVLNLAGQQQVIGIASFSSEGCEHDYKRMFTCVVAHLRWLAINMD